MAPTPSGQKQKSSIQGPITSLISSPSLLPCGHCCQSLKMPSTFLPRGLCTCYSCLEPSSIHETYIFPDTWLAFLPYFTRVTAQTFLLTGRKIIALSPCSIFFFSTSLSPPDNMHLLVCPCAICSATARKPLGEGTCPITSQGLATRGHSINICGRIHSPYYPTAFSAPDQRWVVLETQLGTKEPGPTVQWMIH